MTSLFKTSTAYVVSSAAILGVADIVFETVAVPDKTMQYLIAAILIGFPIALIVSQFFNKKEERDISTEESKSIDKLNKEDKKITASGDYIQKIAVIPFINLNKDEDGAFLIDGIVEDLITEFSMIREIEILSRQTCFNLREQNLTNEDYRNQYGLDFIVSGSIRAVGDRLRISVELSETLEGNVIWSNKYDRVKDDIFDIQDEIVRKITISLIGEIEFSSLKRAHRKPTENMTSYEFLLKGKEGHHKFTKEANIEALKYLDSAIEADANNAQAYAWKACAIGQALGRGYIEYSDENIGRVLTLIDKAIEVDQNDFEAHRMLAEVYLTMHDFKNSKKSGQKAFQMNPNDPRVISVYGEALLREEEIEEGITHLEKAYELDPIPQGQTTSDRRLGALLLAYYLKEDSENFNSTALNLVNYDLRSWLLNIDIHLKEEELYQDKKWYKDGVEEFGESDWSMEIDRFHLNNKPLEGKLLETAQNHSI